MTALLLTVTLTIDIARQAISQAIDRRRDPIGHAIRRAPAAGLVPVGDADRALDRLAAQARRPRGLDFTTPVPTARFG